MRKNNFDFLRFSFALFVVISHSYPLSGSDLSNQWLLKITNNQIELSSLGLNGFFILSGYLIFQSLERSKNIVEYYWKRILRLFPGLFVVLALTILLAPFVYKSSISYLDNREVWTYIPRNLSLFKLQYNIAEIFKDNPYHFAINGSLWTICYEFSFYVLLSILFIIISKRRLVSFLLLFFFLMMFTGYNFFGIQLSQISKFGISAYHFINLGTFFVGGSLLASLNIENFKHKNFLLIIVSIFLVITLYFNLYNFCKHILLTSIILIIGLNPLKYISSFGKMGDPSYGIYIYGFPIQQTLMHFFNLNLSGLLTRSVLISIIFGYLSWHLIEKRALFFKKIFAKTNFDNKC
ncbi:acyltransferase family protein [Flavobacterium sp. CFS9]|uniref:acyltransferase family protein n=1 Tax=Flavobacterium sp. CFS9 TaxID=3143118 RepID=UPI0034E873D8